MLFWFGMSMSFVLRRKPIKRRRSRKKTSLGSPAFDVKLFLDSAGLGRKVGKFRGRETVFAQGDPAKNVMYIQEGGVKLTVVNETGKEAVVAILGPGDFFGEGCLAGQSVCMATATAIAPTTVLVIEKNEMIRVLHGEHEFSDRFIAYMLARNLRVEEDLIDQLFNSSEKRLARTLLLLARYGAPGRDDRLDTPTGQFFHEQVQEAGLHQIQRRDPRQQFPPECCLTRVTNSRVCSDCSWAYAVRASNHGLYDAKTALYRPASVFDDEGRARNVSGTGNPWDSVFVGRCSHPRYTAASRRTRGKNRGLA